MFRSFRHEFDPLDLEILERALNATWAAVKDNRNDPPADFDSNEGLETILKRELIETARFNGVSDPETLRDLLLSRLAAGCRPAGAQVSASAKPRPGKLSETAR